MGSKVKMSSFEEEADEGRLSSKVDCSIVSGGVERLKGVLVLGGGEWKFGNSPSNTNSSSTSEKESGRIGSNTFTCRSSAGVTFVLFCAASTKVTFLFEFLILEFLFLAVFLAEVLFLFFGNCLSFLFFFFWGLYLYSGYSSRWNWRNLSASSM